MAELARGTLADRPWGRTLGALALRGVTGQVSLAADGKHYQIAFVEGAIVGATSPLASDAAVRVAMTGGLISSTQVADVARRQAASPQRDEIEVISELMKLGPDQSLRLRRRTIGQRAARTFAVERGDFVIEDRVTLPLVPGTELDVRSVIYLGARQNLSEARLAAELGGFGTWFRLRPEAYEDLPQFGFGTDEQLLLERLRTGAAVAELENCAIEKRMVHAALYALVSCNACEVDSPSTRTVHSAVASPATSPSSSNRVSTAAEPQTSQRPTTRRKVDASQVHEVQSVIASRLQASRDGADHYALLGVPRDAKQDQIRRAYFALARQLHPDRLSALAIADEARDAQRLFAEVNTAFTVLSDPERAKEYLDILKRGGARAIRAEQAKAEELTARLLESEEACRRGEGALRRDQVATAIAEFARAMELNPDEADYQALHAWAQFCASNDKPAIVKTTRTTLDRAIVKAPRSITARFYLGRVERMLGRDQDALKHFHEVLSIQPNHAEAGSEARAIEQRIASGSGDKKKR